MIMRLIRYFFYTIIIFIIILIPFYGAARLILPDYIKKEIIKSLPRGSSLSIGSVNTKADLRIVFENINYIKISPFCKYISILDYSNGLNFKEVINNCKKKSLRKCCILSEPIMNNDYEVKYRFYHVTF